LGYFTYTRHHEGARRPVARRLSALDRTWHCGHSRPMLTTEQIRGILSEQHAEDLPVAEHMQLWSADNIRQYAEAGGFWCPPEAPSAAAETAPLGWETYEAHAISLDSPGGEALAAAMSDGWAIRCAQITSAFEPQVRVRLTDAQACTRPKPCKRAPACLLTSTRAGIHPKPRNPPEATHPTCNTQAEGSWCGLASLAIVLRALQPTGAAPCGKQGRYGRPTRARLPIGRGWPRLGAALSSIWRWRGVPGGELAEGSRWLLST
jgi:hypothetical protein